VKNRALNRSTRGEFAMAADPTILKRIRNCPFARGGRVLVRFRANGYSLFARRSGEPLVRLRLTGEGDNVVLLYPSHRGGWENLRYYVATATRRRNFRRISVGWRLRRA
jgi:hypothetical protein